MKHTICLCAVILLSSTSLLFAQDVNMTKENVSKVLCKKWKISYIINDGMKIVPLPEQGFNYEFKNDNTFSMTHKGDAINGTWSYDLNKKLIKLKINKISRRFCSLNW